MLKKSWAPVLVLLVTQSGLTQTMPSAGGQMQQMPVVPNWPGQAPQMELAPLVTPSTQPQPAMVFVAKQLNVTGAHAYTHAELLQVADFQSGREINLPQLYLMADKITQHYRREGYFVARAYLPAQEVKDGVITIVVLEGQYGQVALNNTSRLDPQIPSDLLSGLNLGDVIAIEPLEERLLRLSDLPGVQVRSTLVPGASMGLSDLIVEVKPGALVSGSVDADNAGNHYTGENRIGVTLNLNNPTGHGDVATLRALSSGAGLRFVRAAYQALLGKGRVGAAYSDLAYELGHEFKALDANGHARTATLFGRYPWIRSRNTQLTAGLTLDSKVFQDRLDAIPTVTDKRAQVATASLTGDHRDAWGGGGLSSYSLAWTSGHLDIRSPAARALDADTVRTNGRYNKLSFAFSRLQQASPSLAFLASVSGQMASKNLDVSEKMELGGLYGVRAYPEGEAYADEGYLATLEARQLLPISSKLLGQVNVAAFIVQSPVAVVMPPEPPIALPKPWVKVKLEADSLFGFDQDTLQSDGKLPWTNCSWS